MEGDLRFLSHLDCVRAIQRIALRAKIPLRFSQGFNPRPLIWLACPRPVGVATRDDLVALSLDEPVQGRELQRRMNQHAPRGMSFGSARLLQDKRTPRPRRISYELSLDEETAAAAARRLGELDQRASWPVERIKPPQKHRKRPSSRQIDLKEMIESIELDGGAIRWSARPKADTWPRVDEIIRLAGLDDPACVAGVVRTAVVYDL